MRRVPFGRVLVAKRMSEAVRTVARVIVMPGRRGTLAAIGAVTAIRYSIQKAPKAVFHAVSMTTVRGFVNAVGDRHCSYHGDFVFKVPRDGFEPPTLCLEGSSVPAR